MVGLSFSHSVSQAPQTNPSFGWLCCCYGNIFSPIVVITQWSLRTAGEAVLGRCIKGLAVNLQGSHAGPAAGCQLCEIAHLATVGALGDPMSSPWSDVLHCGLCVEWALLLRTSQAQETLVIQERSSRNLNSVILKWKCHFLLFRADRVLRMKAADGRGSFSLDNSAPAPSPLLHTMGSELSEPPSCLAALPTPAMGPALAMALQPRKGSYWCSRPALECHFHLHECK
ncbi:uncharacterized protein LOC126642469 [Myiozetetes cayanensis]|uniref:uncharacterized protein LOC126642469 n=1 Tax=Myiozetetes cayanensis TaxID=478635 RepID=UPI0021607F27|nr:uncharacterized protein LOC126642469 [Myiozetetes cayanensis]